MVRRRIAPVGHIDAIVLQAVGDDVRPGRTQLHADLGFLHLRGCDDVDRGAHGDRIRTVGFLIVVLPLVPDLDSGLVDEVLPLRPGSGDDVDPDRKRPELILDAYPCELCLQTGTRGFGRHDREAVEIGFRYDEVSRLFLERSDPDPEGHFVSRRRLGAAYEHRGRERLVPATCRERYGGNKDEAECEKKRDPHLKSAIRGSDKREFHRYFPSLRAADRTGRYGIHAPETSRGLWANYHEGPEHNPREAESDRKHCPGAGRPNGHTAVSRDRIVGNASLGFVRLTAFRRPASLCAEPRSSSQEENDEKRTQRGRDSGLELGDVEELGLRRRSLPVDRGPGCSVGGVVGSPDDDGGMVGRYINGGPCVPDSARSRLVVQLRSG